MREFLSANRHRVNSALNYETEKSFERKTHFDPKRVLLSLFSVLGEGGWSMLPSLKLISLRLRDFAGWEGFLVKRAINLNSRVESGV